MTTAAGTDAPRTLDVETFRARCAAELSGPSRPLAGWLDDWASSAPATVVHPWAAQGRQYVGFGETFCRTLSWYKPHRISPFRSLGWHLNPDASERISEGFRRLVAEALRDPALVRERATWLREYDVSAISRYTAIDEKFQTLTGRRIERVLDFGSGIGRQALIWSFGRDDVSFTSVEAIESLYLLQHELYLRLFRKRFVESFLEVDESKNKSLSLSPGEVRHLPTWRLTSLPDQSFDLIICVQVLQEINDVTLDHVLQQFRRLIRPEGLLYIRDNEFWTPEHKIRVGRQLLRQGWRLAFRYPGHEGTDIAGVPRLWTFTGEDYSRDFSLPVRLKRVFLPSYRLSFRSWRDIGLPI